MDPAAARAALADPARLLALGLPFLNALQAGLGAPLPGLVCLGGFENVRQEFEWEGVLLELDETKYEWGTLYELECETVRRVAPGGRLGCRLGAAWGAGGPPERSLGGARYGAALGAAVCGAALLCRGARGVVSYTGGFEASLCARLTFPCTHPPPSSCATDRA